MLKNQDNLSTSSFSLFLKKYLLPVLVLLALSGFLFTWLFERYIILATENSGAYKVNRIISQVHEDEIPVLGSSRAEGAFVPELISPHAFNYGLSGVQDNVMLFFLAEEVKKNKTSPVIINFDTDGLSYSLAYRDYYLYNSTYPPVKTLLGDQFKFRYNIPFIKYYGYFESYIKYYLNDQLQVTKKTNRGGNFELNTLTPKKFSELIEERKNTPTFFENDSVLEMQLHHLLNTHPKRTFVFVLSPCHWSYMVSLKNMDGLKAYLSQLASYKNVRIFDMSQMSYPDSLYMNTSHLNYEGAKLFSAALRDSLTRTGIIK